MGDLSRDIELCLCECACEPDVAERAGCSCAEGRVRETKRALLDQRRRLLEEMRATQRGIDTIDHLLDRVTREM